AVQVVVEALRKVEKDSKKKITAMELTDARNAVNKALLSGMAFQTPLGEISLDREGEVVQKQFYVSTIKMNPDGKTGAFVLAK
ncbi:MAG: branched-chain amino acid ABC transporter substrate-binding protein, partial [Desulfovibrio sp.]|nr:branched-chain amino acid ABC transporter substrate-binding protein [Desulfovibrio sp.]